MPRRTVRITIDVPIELVELLERFGPELVQFVGTLANSARTEFERFDRSENTAERIASRLQELKCLGRSLYRQYRQLERERGLNSLQEKARDKVLFDALFGEVRRGDDRRVFALLDFRRKLKKSIRSRRDREIIRLFKAGTSNPAIAERYSLRSGTVAKIIRAYRDANPKLQGISVSKEIEKRGRK